MVFRYFSQVLIVTQGDIFGNKGMGERRKREFGAEISAPA